MVWQVPFSDLRVLDPLERKVLHSSLDQLLDHGCWIMGPEVAELETQLSQLCRRQHVISVSSGTASLYLALRSAGIGPGDEVITTPLSWISSANAIVSVGAIPIFVDIDDSLNLDSQLISEWVSPRTKAILYVHYRGRIADSFGLKKVASDHGLLLLEDASFIFGTPENQEADITCMSLNPTRLLNAYGEAGVILCDDIELAERAQVLRQNGMPDKIYCTEVGINARMDTLQAAFLLQRLANIDTKIKMRRECVAFYLEQLAPLVKSKETRSKEGSLVLPTVQYIETPLFPADFVIETSLRDDLHRYLLTRGIESKILDPILTPLQAAYHNVRWRGDFSLAKKKSKQILALPCHEGLSRTQMLTVAKAIDGFFRS